MSFKKCILYLLVLCLAIVPLTACKGESVIVNIKPESQEVAAACTVDENEKYVLDWDDSQKCVLLKDKETSHIWSTVPYDFFLLNETNVNLSAPVFITYYNPNDGSLMTEKAYSDCIERDNLSVEVKDGKVIMNFYFEVAEIIVPLEISLHKDGLKATVRPKDVKESGKTRLISVSVLPYLCSAPNVTDKSSYVFVPAGSGALMYTDEEVQEFSRGYTAEVFGEEGSRYLLDDTTDEEPIRMPVFGVKNGNEALFAIIDSGAESAEITGDTGNYRNGYSTVYATFRLRGNDETEVERNKFSDALIYAEDMNLKAEYSVSYYPLSGEKADYSGMAELYRSYLENNSVIEDSKLEQKPYQLNFLGGSMVRDVFLGVPYMRTEKATSFEEAKKIIEELSKKTGESPSVLLKGFTEDGTDIGRIAGGFGFSSELGGKKKYLALKEYCDKNGIPLFAEYNVVEFNTSGGGFNTGSDIAQTAGQQLAAFYPIRKNLRTMNDSAKKVALLERKLLDDAVTKLLKKNSYLSGVSLTTLGTMAYSDYSVEKYYSKGDMAAQVTELLGKVKKEGHLLNVGGANSYAAAIADSITDVPLTNGEYYALDETVPFYQMVFHGTSAMYSTPINTAEDAVAHILRAVESGVSPAFVLSDTAEITFADTDSTEYYASVYSGNKESVIGYISATADYFKAVGDKKIKSHNVYSDKGVTVTVFEDGDTVYVNHSDKDFDINGAVLKPYSFQYSDGAKTVSHSFTGGEQ